MSQRNNGRMNGVVQCFAPTAAQIPREVAVLIRNGFNCSVQESIIDPMGRFIILKVEIEDQVYLLVNIYAPNKDKNIAKFFNCLHKTLQMEDLDCEENIIIGGDFNCPFNPKLDKKGGVMFPRKVVIDSIECLQNELDLINIWRIKHPHTSSYTWSQKSPQVFCRLDYWLVSNNLQDFVKSTDIIHAIKTDHVAIDLVLTKLDQYVRGSGFWKMNVSLLEDEVYLEDLKLRIPQWKTTSMNELSDNRSVWDWLKYNIRNHAIDYSKRKAKGKNERERTLQNEYDVAAKLYENNPSALNQNRLNQAKEMLELFYEEKTKVIIIRARARWHEHRERRTKYFLNLEKWNHVKKHIRKLVVSGVITTDPFNILNKEKRLYNDLYKS